MKIMSNKEICENCVFYNEKTIKCKYSIPQMKVKQKDSCHIKSEDGDITLFLKKQNKWKK